MPGLRLISPRTERFELEQPFVLESGQRLDRVQVAYRSWGRWDPRVGNAVLVCHALTGSADVDEWWRGVLGRGKALDPDRDFVLCCNVLGSCYGTTGPASRRPGTAEPYGPDFPAVEVRDMVRLQGLLLDHLGIDRLRLVVGGSLGGMQALEWVASAPERVVAAAVIGAPACHSPWCIALSEAQRAAIRADGAFCGGRYHAGGPPAAGLAAARMIAMCSYRSPAELAARFGRERNDDGDFQVAGYLRHHGEKLVERFDANAYLCLTEAMDRHDLGRGRGGVARALASIKAPVLVVGISSDQLYLPDELERLAAGLGDGRLAWLQSAHGHDAFLIDTDAVNALLDDFRHETAAAARRLAS